MRSFPRYSLLHIGERDLPEVDANYLLIMLRFWRPPLSHVLDEFLFAPNLQRRVPRLLLSYCCLHAFTGQEVPRAYVSRVDLRVGIQCQYLTKEALEHLMIVPPAQVRPSNVSNEEAIPG